MTRHSQVTVSPRRLFHAGIGRTKADHHRLSDGRFSGISEDEKFDAFFDGSHTVERALRRPTNATSLLAHDGCSFPAILVPAQ